MNARSAISMTCLLSLAAFSGSAAAGEYEKNGLPCVKELCIGDGLPELQKIDWVPAKTWASTEVLERVRDIYRGEIATEVAGSLDSPSFDSTVLRYLSSLTSVCSEGGGVLEGAYTAKSGLETRVTISLRPNGDDASTWRWTVASIRRTIGVSNGQEADVAATLLANL